MIRNIVFDMGGVLLDYHPMTTCLRHAATAEDAQIIYDTLFMAPEWEEKLDGCYITEAEMLEIAQDRLSTPELKALCADIFEDYHMDALSPMKGMEEIIRSLHERGFRLFVLSNVGERIHQFKHKIPAYELFAGSLFSGEEKLLKPDPAIFHRLYEKFSLKPEECLFVDDRPVNTAAAESAGMAGYVLADADTAALKRFLEGLLAVE